MDRNLTIAGNEHGACYHSSDSRNQLPQPRHVSELAIVPQILSLA